MRAQQCTKWTKGISEPSLDGFQHLVDKLSGQNQTAILFRYVNPFCRHVAFCEAGYEANVTFLNLPPTPRKSSETKSLSFLSLPVCHLPRRFDEDWLGGLGDIASKKKKRKEKYRLTLT